MKKVIIIVSLIILIIVSYFLFFKIDEKKIVFLLKGDKIIDLYIDDTYIEPGFIASYDNRDISNNVTMSNLEKKIGTQKIIYTLNYKFKTYIIERTINITNDPNSLINLKLEGEEVTYLLLGNEYKESGYSCIDKLDGDITDKVIVNNNIDNNVLGEYSVNYDITNSRDGHTSKERKVIVYDIIYNLDIKVENNQVLFNLNCVEPKNIKVNGEDYINNTNITLNNDILILVNITDIHDNVKELTLDYTIPKLTCNAIVSDNGTDIKVNSSSNIKEYNYFIDNIEYKNNSDSYSNKEVFGKKISVKAISENTNSSLVDCSIEDKGTLIQAGFRSGTISNGSNYYFYTPENTKSYEKKPLLIFMHGSGETGSNKNNLIIYGMGKLIKEGNKYDYFVLLPQKKSTSSWTYSMLKPFMDEVLKNVNYDKNKIVLSGYSQGAYGVTDSLSRYPNSFYKAVLIAPCSSLSGKTKVFSHTKGRVYYGSSDTCQSEYTVNYAVSEVKKNNGFLEPFKMNGYSHQNNIVTDIFKNKDLQNWIFN